MESATVSNPVVTAAWWIGISFTLLALACIAFMIWLRRWSDVVKERKESVANKWEDTLYQVSALDGADTKTIATDARAAEKQKIKEAEKDNLLFKYEESGRFEISVPLEKQEVNHFLHLWNYVHETLRGPSKTYLNLLAENLDLNEKTLRLLKSPLPRNQLLALNTYGNLGDKSAYEKVEPFIYKSDPIISFWAWRALFRIDFDESLKKHFSMIATREDWSPVYIAKLIKEADSDEISEPLARLVEKSFEKRVKERQLSRLISYLAMTHSLTYTPLINRILNESKQTEVIIACLRLVNSDESLPRVRELIKSERWEIRMQVVLTLGRLGHKEDIELLIHALNDLDWWVRYRAACALVTMPGMTEEKIAELSETLSNQFARDILQQVLAEIRLLCFTQPSSSILSK